MLTGNTPYNGKDTESILYAHIHDSIPTLPKDYRHLQPLINKMLANRPEDRFTNASEVLEVLSYLYREGELSPNFVSLNESSVSQS